MTKTQLDNFALDEYDDYSDEAIDIEYSINNLIIRENELSYLSNDDE